MTVSAQIADQIIGVFRAAAEANLRNPYRKGHVVEVSGPEADELMITADLHGNRRNFDRICKLADLQSHCCRHLVMQEVCHGGPSYPSVAGCMSHLLLEDVARLKCQFPDQFHFLLSNHELSELTDFPIMKSGKLLNLAFRCGMQEFYGSSYQPVREAMLSFLGSCPLALRTNNGVFVSHSLPEAVDQQPFDMTIFQRPWTPTDMSKGGAVFELVWGRDFRESNARIFAKLVGAQVLIHGHEPCLGGFHVPNLFQLILDSQDSQGRYLILPLNRTLDHGQIIERIKPLFQFD